MGAPQEHGQRSYKSDIATYDSNLAVSLGILLTFQVESLTKGYNIINTGAI